MYYFQKDSSIYRGEDFEGEDKTLWKVRETAEEAKVYVKRMLWREVKRLLKGMGYGSRI